MKIELIASYTVFPVMSVRKIPRAAMAMPAKAAESSTITVNIVVSLLSLNSKIYCLKVTLSPLCSIDFVNCLYAILKAFASNITAIPRTI